ncbi:MAG: hypothetical protein ACQPRJ_02355 [Solitalea-like symbiont of Acarus siro]
MTNTLFTGEVEYTIYDSYKKNIDGLPIEKINDNLCLVLASERLDSLEIELSASIASDKILDRILKDMRIILITASSIASGKEHVNTKCINCMRFCIDTSRSGAISIQRSRSNRYWAIYSKVKYKENNCQDY